MQRQTKSRRSPARSKAIPIEGLIRVGPLMSVPGIPRAFGPELEPILGNVGLKLGHLEDPDTRIPYVAGSYCARPAFSVERLSGCIEGQRLVDQYPNRAPMARGTSSSP